MTKTCKYYPWQVLQLTFSPHTVKNLFYHLKSVVKTLFWQTMKCFFLIFFILAESGRGRPSIAEKEDRSYGTIVPFVTSDDSSRDHETCWLLDIRSLTNPPDSVISSPKRKGSVINQAEWSWSEDSANVSQGRTGPNRARWGQNGERTSCIRYLPSLQIQFHCTVCTTTSRCKHSVSWL